MLALRLLAPRLQRLAALTKLPDLLLKMLFVLRTKNAQVRLFGRNTSGLGGGGGNGSAFLPLAIERMLLSWARARAAEGLGGREGTSRVCTSQLSTWRLSACSGRE